ncbi:BTB/POZ domain-containing protein 6-B-like [Gigantopelta aegis]|uniref:BTB/POZ domain-containing protein 6-B-like n=1 Tax=Gigantopelta aegis TaxID=1735272 RepID=UPI001B889C38|nr:BTB/POZ domain-containing protein 6-B-like [Gigantopelta aegis]
MCILYRDCDVRNFTLCLLAVTLSLTGCDLYCDKMATCKSSSMAASGHADSWQSRKSLTQSLRHSFENRMFSDVTFKVGREQKTVQAHRQILSIRSGVFEAMFYGPLAEQGEIVIPEVEHDIFEQFLRL